MKVLVITVLALVSLLMLYSCSEQTSEEVVFSSETPLQSDATRSSQAPLTYEQISQEEAKKIMDTEANYIIIDARTAEEFAEGHIANAILIPEYEILQRAENELPNKNQLILVYCRSGRRSKIAAEHLVALGYTNVKEFGGIITWEYGTVK